MTVVGSSSIKEKFIELFSGYKEAGYEDMVKFLDIQVGFSLKKSYGKNKAEISLLKVALIDDTNAKSNVFIEASYGKLSNDSGGLINRNSEEISFHDPVDIIEADKFSYDTKNNCLLKNGNKISGVDALNEVYQEHIKPTKKYRGAFLRLKLWYWRKALKNSVKTVSDLFTFLLIVIAGVKYKYDAFFGEERFDRLEQKLDKQLAETIEKKPIDFFGYEVNKWTIVFYCLLHLALFFVFYFFGLHASYISRIITNNFLTAIYVITSLWLVEFVVPLALTKIIKKLSTVVLNLDFKKIEI